MMKWIPVGALWALICFTLPPAGAQQATFRYRNDVKIVIDSDTIKNPWTGGLNSPVFSKIDLNQDGTEDLFVFDRTHQKVYTFLARQQQGHWDWEYAPGYEYLFPADLSGWVLLRDYDRDGRRDLFTKTSLGIKVYRNVSGAAGPLRFAEAESYLRFDNNINLQASSENLPAITDLDGDGDLDVLTFDFSASSHLEYYQNRQQEENLPADRLKFTLATARWGGLTRCPHVCHAYVYQGACRTSATQHNDGTTLLPLDLDGDGDQEVLIGQETCPELARIINRGTAATAAFSGADLLLAYPENTTPARFAAFPAAYYEDVSFDGRPDLLVAPFARGNTGDDIDFARSSWYYQNTAASGPPQFEYRQKDFLQRQMVDAGEQSAPALADVDADGDADLLVGTRQGHLWLFRNVGSAAKAVFQLETRDYENLSAAGWRDLKPQVTDLNGDGRADLVLAGTRDGSAALGFIANTAALGQPARYPAAALQLLLPGIGGAPAFYDLDGDGDKDLVLASSVPPASTSGTLQFYRNTGSRNSPAFTLAHDNWGHIPRDFSRRNSFPLLADLNRDHQPELLLADDTGALRLYTNIAGEGDATFTPVQEVLPLPGQEAPVSLRLGGSLTLAAADLDGDRLPEIVAGSRGGGLVLLGQEMAGTPAVEPLRFALYPNPAGKWFRVVSDEAVIVAVVNAAGQQVKAFGTVFRKMHEVDVSALSAGLYLVQVRTAGRQQSAHPLVITR